MIPEKVECADVDGVFCIKFTTTDFCNPVIVSHYWPTCHSTRDVLKWFFEDASAIARLPELCAKRTIPGEFFVGIKQTGLNAPWQQGQHMRLLDGAHTQPIKTDKQDAIAPKARKGTQMYWSNGAWTKRTRTGKPERINPLSC